MKANDRAASRDISRFGHFIHLAGFLSSLSYLYLAWTSHQPGSGLLAQLLMCLGLCFFLYFALIGATSRTELPRHCLPAILLWALVFRLLGGFSDPILEDDYFRYLWDGLRFALDGNPYTSVPAQFFDDETVPTAFREVLNGIGYPDLATIYGPISQLTFVAAYYLAPGEVLGIKMVFAVFDIVALCAMIKLVSPARFLLYAWCPLLVHEVAFGLHNDIVGVCFLILALAFFLRQRLAYCALMLALAVASKWTAILAVPFLLRRAGWRAWSVFASLLALAYAPFVGATDFPTLTIFARQWEFNSSVFAVAQAALGRGAAVVILGVLFAGLYLLLLNPRQERDAIKSLLVVFSVFFLFSPVVNPWYLLWLVPLLSFRPSMGLMSWLALSTLSYITWMNLGFANDMPYDHPFWVRLVEYGGVAAVFLWEYLRTRGTRDLADDRVPG